MKFVPLITKHDKEEDSSNPLHGSRPFIVEGLRVISYRGKMKDSENLPFWFDDETQQMWLRYDEDQLIIMHGLLKTLLDLQMQLGNEPTEELLELEMLFSGAVEVLDSIDDEKNEVDSELKKGKNP